MNKPPSISCPNGEKTCPIFEQIKALQDEVVALSTQVRTDYLTGLFNRKHLIFSLEQELERSQRTRQPTTLILIDADHFKSVNDTHGHVIGDKVLEHMSRIIQQGIRKIDIACRYGGEEFAVILPATSAQLGRQVGERIRQQVEESYLTLEDDSKLCITVSIGIDTYDMNSSLTNPESFLKRADKQLYYAKENGRNQVAQSNIKPDIRTDVSADEKEALFDSLDTPKTK